MYYLYILRAEGKDWHYIGSTSNIEKRLIKHNVGDVTSTRPYRPLKLIYTEEFATNTEAKKREFFLKHTAKARVELFKEIEK